MAAQHPFPKWLTLKYVLDKSSVIKFLNPESESPIHIHERLKKCMMMQQWMSAQLGNGFIAVMKLKAKLCRLMKSRAARQRLQ